MSRRQLILAIAFVAGAAAAASIYSFAAQKRYEATARVVVHTIPVTDKTYTGVDVLHASGDTPRDLGTAAHFFDTPEVVSTTATRLSMSPAQLSDSLDVHALAGSNILLVVGKSSSAQQAAQIANGVVQEAISQRTARVQAQVSAIINKLQASKTVEAQRRVVDLQTLQGRADPTLETLSAATAPTKAAWPKPTLVISSVTLTALALVALFLLVPRGLALRRKVLDTGVADRRRAAAIDQRQSELEQVVVVAKDATSGERERLDARLAAVAAREQAMAKQAAEVARRERELAELARRAAEPPPPPPPAPEPEPAPVVVPEEVPVAVPPPVRVEGTFVRPLSGGWTIPLLEQLVGERGAPYPDKVEEWNYYIVFLGEQAELNGALPASFDYLIEETFADLL